MTRTFTCAVTLEDALAALGSGARPVAGGTDLVVGARQGKASLPEAIVAIDRIPSLGGIGGVDGGLRLGALATHEEIVATDVIRERFTALADASAIVGSHATRAHGTIGGNVMNASPAMDTGGPLLCFDATATLRSEGDERVGEGSSPRSRASPVSNNAKLFDVLTPNASSISVARISRTPPLSVSRPSAWRL